MTSYEIFDYGLRPAKAIERKLFTELLREIYGVSPGNDIEYIGLGSPFFIDFKIIHKELNIKNMTNIEKNIGDVERFKFNKPFSCIDLKWGDASTVLPRLNWEGKKIIWLDYDGSIDRYMFDDIDIIFSNVQPNSFFLFSSNSTLPRYGHGTVDNFNRFKSDFDGLIPDGFSKDDLSNKNSPTLIWKMIKSRIEYTLSMRNAAVSEDEHLIYHQMINIIYKDGAPMVTTGGILLEKGSLKSFLQKRLNKLTYIRNKNEFLDLQSPVVTNQEINLMNNYLPNYPSRFMNLKKISFIPEKERRKYFDTYRYYPNFVEISD